MDTMTKVAVPAGVIPLGWYVLVWDPRVFNDDGTPDHGVFGPIPEERLEEWYANEGEWFSCADEEWEVYASCDLLEAIHDLGVTGVEESIWVNGAWFDPEVGWPDEATLYSWVEPK